MIKRRRSIARRIYAVPARRLRDYAMLKWIRNKLFKETPTDEVDETSEEVEEKFEPVGVRVKPPVAVRIKPADSYVVGYNVDESGFDADDEYSSTVNDIKTTGVDPYNTGHIDRTAPKKSDAEK